jgi:hypothetical protein
MSRGGWVGFGIIVSLIAVSLLVWIQGPTVTLSIRSHLENRLAECVPSPTGPSDEGIDPIPSEDETTCDQAFSRIGQTGDLFGSVSSVFSGLALLAVAVTIWFDASQRRSSKKPVIICLVNDERRIVFDDISKAKPRAVRASINLDVSVINDVAMNAKVRCWMKFGTYPVFIGVTDISTPMQAGSTPIVVEFIHRLGEDEVPELAAELRKHDRSIVLDVETSCESLEGVVWKTVVSHTLSFRSSDAEKLVALDGKEDAELDKLWADQATVLVDCSVTPGSWRHFR